MAKESPQEKEAGASGGASCWVHWDGKVWGNGVGPLQCPLHLLLPMHRCACTCVYAAQGNAFCHSFSQWHQTFNVTMSSINHFMLHCERLWLFNLWVKEAYLVTICSPMLLWLTERSKRVAQAVVSEASTYIWEGCSALLGFIIDLPPKRVGLIRRNNVAWELNVKPDPLLLYCDRFHWVPLVNWLQPCSSG